MQCGFVQTRKPEAGGWNRAQHSQHARKSLVRDYFGLSDVRVVDHAERAPQIAIVYYIGRNIAEEWRRFHNELSATLVGQHEIRPLDLGGYRDIGQTPIGWRQSAMESMASVSESCEFKIVPVKIGDGGSDRRTTLANFHDHGMIWIIQIGCPA